MIPNANLTRRALLAGALALPAAARAGSSPLSPVDFRGALNAGEFGIEPGLLDRNSTAFGRLLRDAASRNMPVFLPPGVYELANIDLPASVRLTGVPGATPHR